MRESSSRLRAIAAMLLIALLAPAVAWPDEEADHEALRELRAVYERAIRESRLDLLQAHLDEGFSGVMVTHHAIADFAGLEGYWAEIQELMGPGGRYSVTLQPERSVILGDVALAKGSGEDVVITGEGREYRFDSLWTAVCRREGDGWRILRVHGSMDPLENPFVVAGMKRAGLVAGMVAGAAMFVAGLVLGALGGWIGARRRRTSGG